MVVGDDLEMDRHLITIEEFTSNVAGNADQISANTTASSIRAKLALVTRNVQMTIHPRTVPATSFKPHTQLDLKKKKWRAPFAHISLARQEQGDSIHNDPLDDIPFDFSEQDLEELDDIAGPSTSIANNTRPLRSPPSVTDRPNQSLPAPKRRKVGLSRGSVPLGSGIQPTILSSHRTPSTQLEFPNAARCTNFAGKNTGPKRTISLGARFSSTGQYKDNMSYLIYDHLQVMIIEIAIALWNTKTSPNVKDGEAIDSFYRSKSIHMHSQATLRRRGNPYVGFPMFSGKTASGTGDPSAGPSAAAVAGTQQGAVLTLSNKEHHSKYSKDDMWVISRTSKFDAASTFFARSVFYGPSGNDVEISCLSPSDSSVARELFMNSTSVCAIRLFNAMSEFMMLDNLANELTNTPLLPVILNYIPPELIKVSKTAVFKAPTRIPEKTGCIVLTEDDGIDVEMEVLDTIERFNLNMEQASVLRNFALTVIRAPGWGPKSQEPPPPILLVHGVFGAGKSFLIAVLIIFADIIISKARPVPREERSCRFLVASMTNVAVDRILTALLDLGYTDFVRVGSLKKVARRILPYTAQSSSRPDEDIKELQAELRDDNLPARERHCIKKTIQLFQKGANRDIVEGATVVGATCIASTFETLDSIAFPIVILDEASQLLEPMSLVPLCRAAGEKLILVGDPLQLSPPVTTKVDTAAANSGYTRTLFDRVIEMGIKPIMLKTQYRCHPRIAELSSSLFYSNELKAGMTPQDRAPLVEGLPTLTFIDNDGSEIQNPRSKSFTNPAEARLVVDIVQRLLSLNIPGSDIGVISLYKSQAEAIQASLDELTKVSGLKGGSVQISTVDAFQGSEKDVIIVSTVRTESVGFIDNRQRVNVALSRSKRHLFLVGNSKLLTSNRLWDQIINTHCAVTQDGLIRGEQFTRQLRTLVPLPKPPVTQALEVSDPEDDEEAPRSHQSQSGDQEQWHESEEDTDPTPSPRTGSRTYIKGYQYESESERSDDNEHNSRQGIPERSGTTNTSRVSMSRKNEEPIRATIPPSDVDMAEFSGNHSHPVPPLLPPPPQEYVVASTSASAHQYGDLSRPRHSVQRVSKQDMASESDRSQFEDANGQIGQPIQLPGLETTPAPVSFAKVQEEEVEPEEDVVWEVTEEDYKEYDAAHRQQEAVHKEIIGIDILKAPPSRPPAPTLSKICIPQMLDESDVIDYSESQRLEDLEDLWSLSQPIATRSSLHSTGVPLDPRPPDRERPHDPQDRGLDEEQDLALLEMDDF